MEVLLHSRPAWLTLGLFLLGAARVPAPTGAPAHGAGGQHAVAAEHPHQHAGPCQGRDPACHRDPHRQDALRRRGPAGGGEALCPGVSLTPLEEFFPFKGL